MDEQPEPPDKGGIKGGPKTPGSGRSKGTPNKATQRLKDFLDGVFEEAFQRPEMRAKLVNDLATWQVDPKVLGLLFAYYAGRPAVALDHTVAGTLSLPELIVGSAVVEDETHEE